MDTRTYESLGLHLALGDVDPGRVVNGRSNREILASRVMPGDTQYNACSEAFPGDDVPRATQQHSVEYDSCADAYVRFLLHDLLPTVQAELGCTPGKPTRVFMQSGTRDADILFWSWSLANQEVAAALRFAGYEVQFAFGEGGHNVRHDGALFAESLRRLWA